MGNNFRTALKVLVHNRLQALLTLCGMSVGVAMVVIVAGPGRGAQATIESQIESAGPTQILIHAGNLQPAAIAGRDQDSGGGEVSQGTMSYGIDDAEANASDVVQSAQPTAPPGDAEESHAGDASRGCGVARAGSSPGIRAISAAVEGNMSLDADAEPAGAHRTAATVFRPPGRRCEAGRWWRGRWISPAEHSTGAPVAIVSASGCGEIVAGPRRAPPDRRFARWPRDRSGGRARGQAGSRGQR